MHYQVFERGWLSSNNIMFHDEDGASLVDTGYCTHATQTLALVAQALASHSLSTGHPYTLKRIINTHLHSDHCGGNAALLAAYPGIEVHIPEGEGAAVATWDEAQLSYRATGQECPRFSFTATLKAADTLRLGGRVWQAHTAPGHDPHSLILFEPQSRTLISADALWENGCGVIFPELRGEPGFEPALATLDLIESLGATLVIPGHGAAFSHVDLALQKARGRLRYLQEDPKRNAAHSLRVLLKFYLLETGGAPEAQALSWLQTIPYFWEIQRSCFKAVPHQDLATETLDRLLATGTVRRDDSGGRHLINVD